MNLIFLLVDLSILISICLTDCLAVSFTGGPTVSLAGGPGISCIGSSVFVLIPNTGIALTGSPALGKVFEIA